MWLLKKRKASTDKRRNCLCLLFGGQCGKGNHRFKSLSMDIFPSVSHKTRKHWLAVNLPSSGTKSRAESNSWVDTSRVGSSSSPESTQTTWKPAQSLTWSMRLASLAPSSCFPTFKSHLIHLQYSAMVSFAHCDPLSWMQFTTQPMIQPPALLHAGTAWKTATVHTLHL